MPSPIATLLCHRLRIRAAIRKAGIRATARATGLGTMRVQRYVRGTGSLDAQTHYILADFTGVRLQLPLTDAPKRRRISA